MVTITAKTPRDAARLYSRPALAIYDMAIMGGLARTVWQCPPSRFVALYDELVSTNHAEVGVGTGYCLDRCNAAIDRLTLIDLSPACLAHARQRLARFSPTAHVRDVLHPVHCGGETFSSIALGGVLHCLPGSMQDKAMVFDNLRPVMTPDCVVFGYTLVSDDGILAPAALATRALLNRLRLISNYSDSSGGLRRELERRFKTCAVTRFGAFAFFVASHPSEN